MRKLIPRDWLARSLLSDKGAGAFVLMCQRGSIKHGRALEDLLHIGLLTLNRQVQVRPDFPDKPEF